MNEKFFDLKKEKQDRMINASLKIFANAGYTHASTDDIVREAGISKGLLFHYFTSKLGLYTFLYDYAAKYEQLELSTCIGREETDYFVLLGQIVRAQAECMKSYPYLILFLDRAGSEEDEAAAEATGAQIAAHAEQIRAILARADISAFRPGTDIRMIDRLLTGAFRSLLAESLRLEEGYAAAYEEACMPYLDMMRRFCTMTDTDMPVMGPAVDNM
ncbi:MAG: TetR/AcrR family transcriptional regulator [Lachnospiraceae bacterium]|nr:TetR/AcrR family transcriptional regulator [Lachnospiraceae bacterium]